MNVGLQCWERQVQHLTKNQDFAFNDN